jgi:hypothetical protein
MKLALFNDPFFKAKFHQSINNDSAAAATAPTAGSR